MTPRTEGNDIHPTAVVGSEVELGSQNEIGPFVVITGKGSIGNRNRFLPGVSIGSPSRQRIHSHRPRRTLDSQPEYRIGNDNIFYENCSMHLPMGAKSLVGSRISIGANVHVGHDAEIGDDAILAPGAVIGGFARILRYATVGISSAVHQRMTVGSFAIVGAGAVVVDNLAPATVVAGVPAIYLKPNTLALERYFDRATQKDLVSWLQTGTTPKDSEAASLIKEFRSAVRTDYKNGRCLPEHALGGQAGWSKL